MAWQSHPSQHRTGSLESEFARRSQCPLHKGPFLEQKKTRAVVARVSLPRPFTIFAESFVFVSDAAETRAKGRAREGVRAYLL